MSERMSKDDRRDQLSHILQSRYAEALTKADFTAESVSREAGVSVVWMYRLVGNQFKRLRSTLPGDTSGDETPIEKLKHEVERLRGELREAKVKYKASLNGKVAEAIRHIELLDAENRMLREAIATMQERLKGSKLVITG